MHRKRMHRILTEHGSRMRPERYRRLKEALDRRQPDLTVLMERVSKSHNFSAILRNCDAVGVLEVHAVPPVRGLDLHHATSAGSAKWMRVRRHAGVEAAAAHLRDRAYQIVAAHPGPASVDYRDVDYTSPTAIMVGAELFGISEEGLSLADTVAAVPMVGMVRSLNVSVATSLLLFEALRQRQEALMYERSRLDAEEYGRILFEWGYPRIAARFREHEMPYPPLGEDGALLEPLPPEILASVDAPAAASTDAAAKPDSQEV